MFSAIARVFATRDLRARILFTLLILALYRIGTTVPAPFVNFANVQACIDGFGVGSQQPSSVCLICFLVGRFCSYLSLH